MYDDDSIVVIGAACEYPGASSPGELWENALLGRKAFRRIPAVRLDARGYYSPDRGDTDKYYTTRAAVIEGFAFDRTKYHVSGSTYRSTDSTHWLALDVAARALEGVDLDARKRERTGVIIGNTLGGEFSRAWNMRLRWPYVEKILAAELDLEPGPLRELLTRVETVFKRPFYPPNADTLAGRMSNTIAGRICNYFDFRGGGYAVDGACSSSLLALATAGGALAAGDADYMVAGGVDLSIDPFELVGFSRTGALAEERMAVYDRAANGFLPGEGCGVVVLTRGEIARQRHHMILGSIAGWGVSSDGHGSVTRPEQAGHLAAITRAYARAGFGIESVGYLEGHGTGTVVGDSVELSTFDTALRQSAATRKVAVGSVKGIIGHTKAAAGVAGFLKALFALRHGIVPPSVSTDDPPCEFVGESSRVRFPALAEDWPGDTPRRAGVSSIGFGGINVHLALERRQSTNEYHSAATVATVNAQRQDVELVLVRGESRDELVRRMRELAEQTEELSIAEFSDLARDSCRSPGHPPTAQRAAIIAADPASAARKLRKAAELANTGDRRWLDPVGGIFVSAARNGGVATPAIGLLFPGHGISANALTGTALVTRLPQLVDDNRFEELGIGYSPKTQADILGGSLRGLAVLELLGIRASAAIGHSLGELAALHWAGGIATADELVHIARLRENAMRTAGSAVRGGLVSLWTDVTTTAELLGGTGATVACLNGPAQTVVTGSDPELARVCERADSAGVRMVRMAVDHAFHSELLHGAADALGAALGQRSYSSLHADVYSTVTGSLLRPDIDVLKLLIEQVCAPVLFAPALTSLSARVDLLVEVGYGHALADLAASICPDIPVVSLDPGGRSLHGLLTVAAAAIAVGVPPKLGALVDGYPRRTVPSVLTFFANPCEEVRYSSWARETEVVASPSASASLAPVATSNFVHTDDAQSTVDAVRAWMADRLELPLEELLPETRVLDELHVSSITVFEMLAALSGTDSRISPAKSIATLTISDVADLIDAQEATAKQVDDVAPGPEWVHLFRIRDIADESIDELDGDSAAAAEPGLWRSTSLGDTSCEADLISEVLRRLPGEGDLFVLGYIDSTAIEALSPLQVAVQQAAAGNSRKFVLLDIGDNNDTALVKSFHLETGIPTVVVGIRGEEARCALANDDLRASLARRIARDIIGADVFAEIDYSGTAFDRTRPVLESHDDSSPSRRIPLSDADVVLASGGAQGITYECVRELARTTGCTLALLGRSSPDSKPIAAAVSTLEYSGIRVRYYSADVTDPAAVERVVRRIESELGTVSCIAHGAGFNQPRAIRELTAADYLRTIGPKVLGLRNLTAAVGFESLKLVIAFGSIIGRVGLHGELPYAAANQRMANEMAALERTHSTCRFLTIEWSVWSETGMAVRPGILQGMTSQGIEPIPPTLGVRAFIDILRDNGSDSVFVVTNRIPDWPTMQLRRPPVPLRRFTDGVKLFYPGAEIVTESTLSCAGDLYLFDHIVGGTPVFPAVMALEAVRQCVDALRPGSTVSFADVEFARAVTVPQSGETRLRVIVQRSNRSSFHWAIRVGDTDFHVDHMAGTAHLDDVVPGVVDDTTVRVDPVREHGSDAKPDVQRDFYGGFVFHGPMFQRIKAFQFIAPRAVAARLSSPAKRIRWFSDRFPQELATGDVGILDSLMHMLQVCVPEQRLVPVGLGRLEVLAVHDHSTELEAVAREQYSAGGLYSYDVDLSAGPDGRVVARLRDLRLRVIGPNTSFDTASPVLVRPYFQRRLDDCRIELSLQLDELVRSWSGGVEPAGTADWHPAGSSPDGTYRAAWSLVAAGGNDTGIGVFLESVPVQWFGRQWTLSVKVEPSPQRAGGGR